MNHELERILKEQLGAYSDQHTAICLQRLRKIRKTSGESNRAPPEYEYSTLPRKRDEYLNCEDLTAVTTKITIFWDMIPCISADSYQRFQRTCLFPIQRRTVFFTLKMKAAESCETFAPSDTLRHILENFNLHIFVCCLQGYNSVEGFQRFGSPNCLNLQGMRNQQ